MPFGKLLPHTSPTRASSLILLAGLPTNAFIGHIKTRHAAEIFRYLVFEVMKIYDNALLTSRVATI
jgi:hypothetical protein